ncbi:ribonuclease H2 subunit B-like isoform X2 [Antedon mediterranea]|uniref:ribonuclease H2 subunit B-like isoform X2 n=1 Tax=Antedon mediterranea TaxID=105859 RepID=UPI003AF6174D
MFHSGLHFFQVECELTTENDECERPVFIKLRHPKTDKCAMYLVGNDGYRIYEVFANKEKCSSWFIGETVQKDGSLQILTPVDPLFLVLPYLMKSATNGMFMTIDQIISDADYPQCNRLVKCCEKCDMSQVSDTKGSEDFQAYRYNEEKTITWLSAKVKQVEIKLDEKRIHVTSGAKSASFVRNSKENAIEREQYTKYAVGLVRDYLNISLAEKLTTHFGIEEKVTPKREPAAKRIKLSKDLPEATEDYSKYLKEKPSKGKQSKLTTQQKCLQKVDKKGMKSISSFFGKPSK